MVIRYIKKILPLSTLPRKIRYRLYKDVLKRETAFTSVLDFKMTLPVQTRGIGRALMIFGERELDQYYILNKVLKKGDIVMDIGSNIGYYCSIESRIVGPTGHIYCFEPDIRNFTILEKNLEENGGGDITEIFNAPVSDAAREVDFNLAEESNLSSMTLTRGDENSVLFERNMHNRSYVDVVKLTTVDFCDFLSKAEPAVDLIRMDIEGHEAIILKALADKLEADPDFARAPKTFVFEPHSWEYEESSHIFKSLTRLAKFGYEITYLGSRSEPGSPISQRGYKPVHTAREKRGMTRGVYKDVDQSDAIELASNVDGVTTVCLQRKN